LIWAFIVFLFLVRLVYSAIMDLSPEEAYYWNYAMHPALSYFDHPPMVAWVISMGTFLFGKTEIGVRIGGIILALGSTFLIYFLGKMWFDNKSGLWAALLFQVIPIYFIYGFTITPDIPLIFFWLMTMYLVSISLLGDKKWGWYAAGFTLGCSMLSKYPGVFLVPSTFLFLLVNRGYRKWLWRKEPYIALIISLLVISPVIVWNYQHHWASFNFQFSQRFSKDAHHPLLYFLRFLGSQMGVLFPTFFFGLLLVLVASFRLSIKDWDPKWKFVFFYSFPLLLLFSFYSTKGEVKVNWALPGYLSLFIAAYPCYRYLRRKAKGRWKVVVSRVTAFSIYAMPVVFLFFLYHLSIGIPLVPPLTKLGGWEQLGAAMEKEEMAMEKETGRDPFLVGMSKYHIAAELAFYTDEPYDTFSSNLFGGPSLAFEYWTHKKVLQNRDALVISKEPPNLDFLKNYFVRVDKRIRPIVVTRQGQTIQSFYLTRCYQYTG
ncbi:MAG: glycosyltransferase family 39 protein, partial [Pseudomonadota bacterium]